MKVKGIAKLIRYTNEPESTIALAAKLCYSSDEMEDLVMNTQKADNAKFIKMLLSIGHFSPFEHASFTFSIEGVSRALLAQITRHRIASFSVRSQRYVSEVDFNYIIPPSIEKLGKAASDKYISQIEQTLCWYKEWQELLGGKGESANEDARFILPNACETKMIVTMNARELMHFFSLRCCNRAQWEIREIAWQMLEACLTVAPNIFAQCGPKCINDSCPEGKKSCGKPAEVKAKKQELIDNINEKLKKISSLID